MPSTSFGWEKGMKLLLRLVIFVSVATALSCGTENQQLNVIVIGVDTLRPDYLGCYGSEHNTSPNIDRLAANGVVAETAIRQAPWTLPSFATVFTSLYPTQHGATTVDTRMRTGFPTLASILKDAGYATGAIVNVPVLKPEFGVSRGFDHYDVGPPDMKRVADEVTDDALGWIDLQRGKPFFIFAHYFDPHLAYSPPAPYDTLFDPDYSGSLRNSFDVGRFCPRNKGRDALLNKIKSLSSADSNHIESLYRGEIAFTDQAIGKLLGELERRNLREHTLIVFLADHGEEFFDHGGLDHGHSLFGELIRVPLIFGLPGIIPENKRISQYVRLLDVTPTILDILGLTAPANLEGISLKSLLLGNGKIDDADSGLLPLGTCYSEALSNSMSRKSIIRYPWKLIYDLVREEKMLFNIEDDPGEKRNLVEEYPKIVGSLEEQLIKTVFGLSDTWFVEMVADGKGHAFDLKIKSEEGSMVGCIYLCRFFDSGGHLLNMDHLMVPRPSKSVFNIENLVVKNPLTLAFKSTDGLPFRFIGTTIPLSFDLRINAKPAIGETLLGEELRTPDAMPFVLEAAGSGAGAHGRPSIKVDPPYFLIWHSESQYKGKARFRLNEQTRRELRALGYIQ
jgi:arylsulfatase A-like enzyme